MGLLDELSSLERQRFFHGQRLLASDLNELEAFHRELRELHNRSLHQPGLGNGFAVNAAAGDRELTVGPGYAIDAEGREIVLTAEHVEPVPPVAGEDDGGPATYDLTVAHAPDEDLEEAETRAGICLPGGTVRLREEPVFCWVRLVLDLSGKLVPAEARLKEDIAVGLKLRLARVEVQDCALASLSVAQRLDARPPTQPRIECGLADPEWRQVEELDESSFVAPFVLSATIDTSDRDFRTTPCYSARLVGSRLLTVTDDGEDEVFADGILSIVDPKPDSFGIQLLVVTTAPSALAFDDEEELAALFDVWDVEWMAVE